jgi:palmitoyltransferase
MNSKGTASPANEVELKTVQRDAPKGSIPLGEDIMQLARIGEIGAMQNMFTTKNLTANHRDEEGITPLHVCFRYSISPRYTADVGITGMRALREVVTY